jgi:hypothetical protein
LVIKYNIDAVWTTSKYGRLTFAEKNPPPKNRTAGGRNRTAEKKKRQKAKKTYFQNLLKLDEIIIKKIF